MRKRLRLELAVGAAALFLLSVAVTLSILTSSARRQPQAAGSPPPEPAPAAGQAASAPAVGRLGITDFLLEAPEAPPQPRLHLFRERLPRWTEQQVQRYWIPVNEAMLRILRRENDRRIEELLREVP